MFTEVNPDKGTKTLQRVQEQEHFFLFTEVNPDKGTKTDDCICCIRISPGFTEVNPDKGTKTTMKHTLLHQEHVYRS